MEHRFYENNVVYQIYPRSFADSNHDGIGDIPGIISKLPYIGRLGAKIIWLSPVYKTANADFGYDVADYYSINPEYGTMEDMEHLIAEAKRWGIRIVMDLVVNHTSDEHPWFQESLKKDSPFHSFYYWRKGKKGNSLPPNNWTSNFGGPAWTYVPEVDEWYLHLFGEKQPDLDWHNPQVLEEVEKIIRFWLDKGVYGFRCDVINEIWKDSLEDGKKAIWLQGKEHYVTKEGFHAIMRKLHDDVYSKYDSMTVGETYAIDFASARRLADRELDMFFQFDTTNVDKWLVPIFKRRYRPKRFKETIVAWQKEVPWNANFLENHDQPRSIERFGNAKKYWKESGKMLATLLLTLRGTPFIYQGQEIGMLDYPVFKPEEFKDPVNFWLYRLLRKLHFGEKRTLRLIQNMNRDNARTPMQWDASPFAGFTAGKTSWLPINPNHEAINVESEEQDPDSILAYYREAIELRRRCAPLSYGDFQYIPTGPNVLAYYRSSEGSVVLVLLNLTGKTVALPKSLRNVKGEVLLSNYKGAGLTYKKKLRPYEAIVARIL